MTDPWTLLREYAVLDDMHFPSAAPYQWMQWTDKMRAALAEYDAQPAAQPAMSMKKAERESLSKPAMDILNTAIGGPNAPYREDKKSIGRDDPRHPLYQVAQPAAKQERSRCIGTIERILEPRHPQDDEAFDGLDQD